ncbi:MAG TPA: phytoene desaturase [Planctomycetaceae bacterium]|nr:phytoene desaturase [Blastopirellula sp.]HAY82355.1 phytoene desaturase [Planctomycetaceae bacterium]
MSRRVVIIGAGPGGLASAMLLAHAGLDVTVIERQPYVGGRTSSIHSGGFRFDRGPTFFLYPRILSEIFAQTGYSLFDEVDLRRLDPQYRLAFGAGGQLDATPDVPRMEAEIRRLAPGEEGGFQQFMAENRNKLERFTSILERPFHSIRDLFRGDILRALPLLRPWRSLHREVGKHFRDPRLQLAFTFQGKYLGMSPFQCPSLFSILSFLEYEHGVWHPIGGCGAVSQVMARIARQLGAKIVLNEAVEEVRFEGRRATGVRTANDVYDCDALIINADFAQAMKRLVPDRLRRRWKDATIAKKKFSCSTFMLYLGMEGRQDDLPHHTIFLSENYRQNLRDIETCKRLPESPSFYVQNPSVTDPTLAPEGRSTLYVLVPVPHQTASIDWHREAEPFRRRVLQQLERIGIKNVDRRCRVQHVVTPQDWEHQGIYRGATFNLAHSLRQMLHLRPRNRFEDLDSVYLVGGGTHPGSGLPTIYSSARITSETLMDDLGLPTSLEVVDRSLPERRLLIPTHAAPE